MPVSQEIVHKFEIVSQSRILKLFIVLLAVILLAVVYNVRVYRNLSAPEAMDAAQLARNISEGKGYTTDFIRPFSIHLIEKRSRETLSESGQQTGYPARLKETHPDISNAPLYPMLLAGWMKVASFRFDAPPARTFSYYRPDFLIALLNQILFALVVAAAFLWARRLFDSAVAWTSTAILIGTELLWQFSVSGLSTMLLLLIFMGLVWALTFVEQEGREPRRGTAWLVGFSAVAGLMAGLGGLTRYSFAWMIIPTVIFLILFAGTLRPAACLAALLAFSAVMAPWVIRNVNVSGAPFGTAGYAALQETRLYPDSRLERSLEPNVQVVLRPIWAKAGTNLRDALRNDLFKTGSGFVMGLFFVSALIGFRNPTLRRLLYFVFGGMILLLLVQSVIQNAWSLETPLVNAANLLVIFVPLIAVYGAALFHVLLTQIPGRELKWVAVGVLGVVVWLPLLLTLIVGRPSPVAFPPYYPPAIQQAAGWMKSDELVMTDVPWAFAWYGDRQSIWLTLNAVPAEEGLSHETFYEVNDFRKPVSALFLTPRTTDSRLYSETIRPNGVSWPSFAAKAYTGEVPSRFPLFRTPPAGFGYLSEHIFLTDQTRW